MTSGDDITKKKRASKKVKMSRPGNSARPGNTRKSAPADKTPAKKPLLDKKQAATTIRQAGAVLDVADSTVPVVGVGASAGGLEAFRALLKNLPANTGMAFVLIQHLDPHHTSLLPKLLADYSAVPVVEARDGQRLEANHVYVIAPNCTLGIHHGKLQLMARMLNAGLHLPVDNFFGNLADDLGSKAIGVILSGTASDGTLGLKAIKAASGITFAQDEASAEYFGMPGNAIAAGCVDLVLPPKDIAKELTRISRHPFLFHNQMIEAASTSEIDDSLSKIFLLLRTRTGNDFTYYKQTTILRRIKRRLMVHKLERLPDYVRYLQATPMELDLLFQDLLINVTGFFRDPDSFLSLKEKVLSRILQERIRHQPIRIWIPGCSTGEEVYSVAITIMEQAELQNSVPQVQLFATDIDEKAIDQARAGVYAERITEEVSPERLRRYFVKVTGGYQINKTIRDMCVFATQNLIKDPPFSRLDLICCRNLMIYLGGVLQKKVLQIFHYALNPEGFLMLGTSESIGSHADLFAMVDRKSKIYTKKSIASRINYEFNTRTYHADDSPPPYPREAPRSSAAGYQQEADQLVLNQYGPPGVVINLDMEILSFRGATGPYLNPAPGSASLNLLKLVRQELSVELRSAIHKARKEQITVRQEGASYRQNGSEGMVNIIVHPLQSAAVDEPCLLVLFEAAIRPPKDAQTATGKGQEKPTASDQELVRILEQELASTREYMQSIIEEQEGTNEELKSANEEIQSTNEELQSTNEELETAKEELQSINEELATVNEELENRNTELAASNNDLNNLLASVNLPILMLGHDLTIRQFTSQAKQLLNLIDADLGRPINNIMPNIEIPKLEDQVLEVIDTMTSRNLELMDKDGHWFSVRIRPYKTLDKRIDGAVLTFVDIDMLKDREQLKLTLEQERRLATVVKDANDAITVQDFNGRIQAWNPAAQRIYGYTEEQALGMNIEQMIPQNQLDHYLEKLAQLRKGMTVDAFETQRITQDGSQLSILLTATALLNEHNQTYAIATTERVLSKT